MKMMELEEGNPDFTVAHDRRPRLAEPLPVRLVAVDHVRLCAPVGIEAKLDAFYVDLLEFERVKGELTYRADNFVLRFELHDRPVEHASLRPQGIEVQSLAEAAKKLAEAEVEFTRQKGMTPGEETLVLLDPAGNWIELIEFRTVP